MHTLSKIIYTISFILYHALLFAQADTWQQRADYDIAVDVNTEEKTMSGTSTLVYTNNSPDTLFHVYFHLYFNAFQKNSLMDIRAQQIPDVEMELSYRISEMTPEESGNVQIVTLTQEEEQIMFIIDGTILTAVLPKAVLPGQNTVFQMAFETKIPRLMRRAGYDSDEGIAFSMAQWYPKICVYDDEGWHAYQYLGREFYSNFGDYKVDIIIDSDFVVAAGSDTVEKIPVPDSKKTLWRFHSKDVIDFAWAADTDYKSFSVETECGIRLHMYYLQKYNRDNTWQKTAEAIRQVFPYINQRFGHYPYSSYTIIQAGDGGMEYPKCTFVTGDRSLGSLTGVSIHELMHTWFQAVVATNENKYAWMDEGLVSFATTEIKQYMGQNGILFEGETEHPYRQQQEDYRYIVELKIEEPLNTPADFFESSTAYYFASYTKGELFLKQLEYITGKEIFDQGLRSYYEKWKFRHPKPADFQKVMERVTGMELDWFFHYWLNTTEHIDLELVVDTSVEGITRIYLMNKGRIPMPADLVIEYDDGLSTLLYIPIDLMQWPKNPEEDVVSGHTMIFTMDNWSWPYLTYVIELSMDAKDIRSIKIDPSGRLVDLNPENNVWINN